jgi:hypothetical protein
VYKVVGICLALGSGLFIGSSFILKKKGLLAANIKYNEEAGEGYGYLKNVWWWSGMILMIVGEILNFAAYAFAEPVLVTPLGALSVVVTTIGSAVFLKERLSFVGKVSCFLCILGSIVIAVNAPQDSPIKDVESMKRYAIAPGFLSYTGVVLVGSAILAFWAGPKYGKKSMLVYISICSWVGGLSVVATQGLGAAIITQASGRAQFNQWFLYVLLVFVIGTLVTEIIFLNKALNIFNAALVTPTYYVYFTSATIITSVILVRGFSGTPAQLVSVILGFLTICSGVVLLQLSKSAKDVPDTAVFTGDLDQVRTVAEQEQPESEPKADAIRGTAALIRRISVARQKKEVEEAKRYHQERVESMAPIREDEQFEWDGIRRRRTQSGATDTVPPGSLKRRKTLHPPLGLTHFPDETEGDDDDHRPASHDRPDGSDDGRGFIGSIRSRASRARSTWLPGQRKTIGSESGEAPSPTHPVPLTQISASHYDKDTSTASYPYYGSEGSDAGAKDHVYGLPPGLQRPRGPQDHHHPPSSSRSHLAPSSSGTHMQWADGVDESGEQRAVTPKSPMLGTPPPAKRQFSFQKVFGRNKTAQPYDDEPADPPPTSTIRPVSRKGIGSRHSSNPSHSRIGSKGATEEERLGLVKGDGSGVLSPPPDYLSEEDDWQLEGKPPLRSTGSERFEELALNEEKDGEADPASYQQRERRQQTAEEEQPPPPISKDDEPRGQVTGRRRKGSRAAWEEGSDGRSDGPPPPPPPPPAPGAGAGSTFF